MGVKFDTARLARWLEERVGAVGRLALSRLSAGRSNLTYLIRTDDALFVLRRPPEGTLAARAHDVLREARILAAVGEHGLAVPPIIGSESEESIAGAPFFVMGYCPGEIVDSVGPASRFSAVQARYLCEQVVDILADIHGIDVLDGTFDWLGYPVGYIERRILRWQEQWHRNAHRELSLIDDLAAVLLDHQPAEQPAALVHGDYRLGNLLVDPENAKVNGVLDWELCTRGDPLTDLAHLSIYWQPMPERRWHPGQDVAALPGFLSAADLMQRYSTRSGRSVDQFDFYHVLGHWRSAIIKEAIYQRFLAGNTPGEDYASFGDAVVDHLLEARDLARASAHFH